MGWGSHAGSLRMRIGLNWRIRPIVPRRARPSEAYPASASARATQACISATLYAVPIRLSPPINGT